MKFKTLVNLSAVALILGSSVVGCKKNRQNVTPLPGYGSRTVGGSDKLSGPIEPQTPIRIDDPVNTKIGGGPQLGGPRIDWREDRGTFQAQTVYFEFDKSNIKQSEVSKLEAIASQFKGMTGAALRIEGHCDERGTEEYNRSLGERRALAAREFLVRLGVDPNLIETISHGEDKPAELGHDEAAWSKNRRAEFVLLTPP